MREITLALPGLLWPADSAAEATRGLALPALGALLTHARRTQSPPQTLDQTLVHEFGLDTATAPYAALRLAGCGVEPGDAVWMCADPVHLRFARDTLVLADDAEIRVQPDEAARLVADINASFADVGVFEATKSGQWHVRVQALPALTTHSVAQVLGRNIEMFLPEGDDSRTWRRTSNEIQVLLHAHPVNATRETARDLAINSLWLWGAGRMPHALPSSHQAVLGESALARGLAHASGATAGPLPDGVAAIKLAADTSVLIVLDRLQHAATYQDVDTWRDGLQELEAAWFAPLVEALRRKRIQRLRLLCPGDILGIELECGTAGWWKFWQQPTSLDAFMRTLSAP